MGVDAYRLGSRLQWMSQNPQARVAGKTGILRMDSKGRIYRQLTLARIGATGPVKVAAAEPGEPRALAGTMPLRSSGARLVVLRSPHLAAAQP
jgi:hypothetical protein